MTETTVPAQRPSPAADNAAPEPAPRLTMLEGMEVVFDARVGLEPVTLVRRSDAS